MYVGVGLTGLVLLATAFMQRRDTLSPAGLAVFAVAALVLVGWSVMGVDTSRRQAREAAERMRREAEAQARKEAQDAARRAARVVNARRTTSLRGTITVHRRSSNARAREQE